MKKLSVVLGAMVIVSYLLFGGAFSLVTPANASLLTWKITGEVDVVGTPLMHIFSEGDKVEYVFTFDPLTPDSDLDPVWGRYSNAISTANITVGSYSATIQNYNIQVINDIVAAGGQLKDSVSFHVPNADTILNGADLLGSDNRVYHFSALNGSFDEQGSSPSMLSNDLLPTSVDVLNNQATSKGFYVSWLASLGGSVYLANGITTKNIQLEDITSVVPIPSAIWLLGSAFIGLIGFRNKIRKETTK